MGGQIDPAHRMAVIPYDRLRCIGRDHRTWAYHRLSDGSDMKKRGEYVEWFEDVQRARAELARALPSEIYARRFMSKCADLRRDIADAEIDRIKSRAERRREERACKALD